MRNCTVLITREPVIVDPEAALHADASRELADLRQVIALGARQIAEVGTTA